jgi:hypothetical protein
VSSGARTYQRVHSFDGDWDRALELLATVEPDGHMPAATFLADEAGPAARALELTVVSASLTPRLVDRLLQRTLAHHGAALVYVDPASFSGGTRPEPAVTAQLVRLDRAGIPTVVVRRGDALAAKLAGETGAQAAAVGGLRA